MGYVIIVAIEFLLTFIGVTLLIVYKNKHAWRHDRTRPIHRSTAETVLASYEKKRIIGLFVDYFFFFIDQIVYLPMKKRLKNNDHEKTDDYFGGDDGDSRLRPCDEFL